MCFRALSFANDQFSIVVGDLRSYPYNQGLAEIRDAEVGIADTERGWVIAAAGLGWGGLIVCAEDN